MSLILNEEERALSDIARDFFAGRNCIEGLRQRRQSVQAPSFDRALWQDAIVLGWSAIPFQEQYGGLEFGLKGLAAVFEQAGYHLAATPLLSGTTLCGATLELCDNAMLAETWLPALISGEKHLAFACDEGIRHNPDKCHARLEPMVTGYRLSGEKTMVCDASNSDGFIVSARLGDELALVLVTADDSITVTPQRLIDSTDISSVQFRDVNVSRDQILCTVNADALLTKVLDRGRVMLASEMLGGAQKMLDMTLDYLRERVQFDTPIGSFQALQHRAAHLFVELELARSSVLGALDAQEQGRESSSLLASLAKWSAGQALEKISNEAVQMHGGIGVTDEYDLGLYLKRARVQQLLLGDSDYHGWRYGQLATQTREH